MIGNWLSSEDKQKLINEIPYPTAFEIILKHKNKKYALCHIKAKYSGEDRYEFAGRISEL